MRRPGGSVDEQKQILLTVSPQLWMKPTLLIFVHRIKKEFMIMEEQTATRSMKGTMTGSDLFMWVSACLEMGQNWQVLQSMAVQILQGRMVAF